MMGRLLAIDTATSRTVLALGDADGQPLAEAAWPAAHAHAETLLPRLRDLLEAAELSLGALSGVVVGIGPGAFTGLRVGLATAKTLAHGLDIPIVGVSTADALVTALGVPRPAWVVLPAGPRDRYRIAVGAEPGDRVDAGLVSPLALTGWLADREAGDDGRILAVDLDEAVLPAEARRAGRAALEGLGVALLGLGARALAADRRDDVAALVPAYVTLPRGMTEEGRATTWSPDLR